MATNKDDPKHQSHGRGGEHKSGRGFAGMDEEKQREIASKGGHAAHEKGTAHEFTSEEARAAGRKGGEAVSQDREHMAEIGAKGGHASHGGRSRSEEGSRSSEGARSERRGSEEEEERRSRSQSGGQGRGERGERGR
ncbi:KGG domain-containing protein [Nannocystis radixulma]|uniref:KGG domain-containing protein n=1 Tax=Nannocystis radixulma TaxID=2995305 RepID=A0ABT5B2R7_9BACT|nr:KGG domain-containing protein [Nannocystis radixulma]MDC0668386.1 KGG domain-containing protein [Nannocystis radixulma]